MKTKHIIITFFLAAGMIVATASTFASTNAGNRLGKSMMKQNNQTRMRTGERPLFGSGAHVGSGNRPEPRPCTISGTNQTGICERMGIGKRPPFGSGQHLGTGNIKPPFGSGDFTGSGNKEKIKLKNGLKLGSGNAASLSSGFREKVKGLTGEKASLFKTLRNQLFGSSSE